MIRILGQTRPLLLGLEQAGGSWLASAEASSHGSTGFLRTTSMLDRCCKAKGYFLKKSCLKPQTLLEVHSGRLGLLSLRSLFFNENLIRDRTVPAGSPFPAAPALKSLFLH